MTVHHKLPLADEWLCAAILSAHEVRDLEQPGAEGRLFHVRMEHLANSMKSITASVAFLEAHINEWYSNTTRAGEWTAIPPETERLQQIWELLACDRAKLLTKFDAALLLSGLTAFEQGRSPRRAVEILIELRNELVHFRPRIQPGGGWPQGTAGKLPRLQDSLRGLFSESPLAKDHDIYFPYRCVGYGACKWSITSVLTFVDEFERRFGRGYGPRWITEKVAQL